MRSVESKKILSKQKCDWPIQVSGGRGVSMTRSVPGMNKIIVDSDTVVSSATDSAGRKTSVRIRRRNSTFFTMTPFGNKLSRAFLLSGMCSYFQDRNREHSNPCRYCFAISQFLTTYTVQTALSWVPSKVSRITSVFCVCVHTILPWLCFPVPQSSNLPGKPSYLGRTPGCGYQTYNTGITTIPSSYLHLSAVNTNTPVRNSTGRQPGVLLLSCQKSLGLFRPLVLYTNWELYCPLTVLEVKKNPR